VNAGQRQRLVNVRAHLAAALELARHAKRELRGDESLLDVDVYGVEAAEREIDEAMHSLRLAEHVAEAMSGRLPPV
jgi:hypothetical protein